MWGALITQAAQDIWIFEHGNSHGASAVSQLDYYSALWFLKRLTTEQYWELVEKLNGDTGAEHNADKGV